jgi:hypothetical protein
VRIFGEQGVALLPLMAQNLEEVQARMERLGAVLSADQTEAIEGMNDALTMVQATFEGIIGQVVGNLAPVVTALAEEFWRSSNHLTACLVKVAPESPTQSRTPCLTSWTTSPRCLITLWQALKALA